MRDLLLLAAITLTSCARSPTTAPLKEDQSIVFPEFFERVGTVVDEPGEPYDLDGVTLRAITIAANDLIPPPVKDTPCWNRPEAYRYRIIRQGDIIFVRIYANAAYCDHNFLILDSGARYAISLDGRILRRVFDGEPEGGPTPPTPDAGDHESSGALSIPRFSPGEPDPSFLEFVRRKKAAESARPDSGVPLSQERDGRSPAPLDGGSSETPDGGL
jgi:hypothetical protein